MVLMIINKLYKRLNMPKYRIKEEDVIVSITEHYVTLTKHSQGSFSTITLSRDLYFKIRDKMRDYDRKHNAVCN